jgi:hypothetical protein
MARLGAGWRRLLMHDLGAGYAQVLGWGTPSFFEVRDQVNPIVIRAALREPIDGLVLTHIFEPTVDLAQFDEYAAMVDRLVFVGLRCESGEHERRASSEGRVARRKAIDATTLRWLLADGKHDFPADLPGESHVIDTTGRAPEDVAEEIVSLL